MNEQVIFLAALDKDPAERAAFLDEMCGGDTELRRGVETLLRLDAQPHDFLDVPALERLAANPAEPANAADDLSFLAPPSELGSLGRLDHYEILEVVGRGGTGIVLRARDSKLQRVVAVKVLAAPLAVSGAARQRFVREARAAAAVRDEHVIDIHAVCDDGPAPYLVMEFIDGCTLEGLLRKGGPREVKEILRIGIQVARGLAAAHQHGLIHRDVKPANILLENGVQRVKLSDFGLARAADDASLTQSGFIAGTPLYMAPEQANGERIDARSDLFGLGSVLYELCTGRPAFRAPTTPAVIRRVCEETPRPIREVNPDIPEPLCRVIERLHAKKPADRPATATEVADLLAGLLADLQQANSGAHAAHVPADRPRGQQARRIVVALLLVGIAVLAASGVASWLLPRRNEASRELPRGEDESGHPPSLGTAAELARLPSPFDARKREAMQSPANAPPELIAILGEPRRFGLPKRTRAHWMAQSNDGQMLAVPYGADILLFEAGTGTLLRTLMGDTGDSYRPAFSPDGKHLAFGSASSVLRVWDVATGKEELTLKGHQHWLWCAIYDPEGKRLVSADAGGTVKVWDTKGQLLTSFAGHTKGINHLAFSPDGKRLATASLDGACKIWDADNWKEIRSLSSNGQTFEAVAWSRDGKRLAAGDDVEVILWNADSYEVLHTLKTPGKGLLAFTPDGRILLTARHDYTKGEGHAFTRWDVQTGTKQTTCTLPGRSIADFVHLSTDGRTVFVSEHQPEEVRVRAYDAQTGQERFPLRGHASAVRSVAFSPDGRLLASGDEAGEVRVWNLPGGTLRYTLPMLGPGAYALAFSPDGKLLLTAAAQGDGDINIWEAKTGKLDGTLKGHTSGLFELSFGPDGKILVSAGWDCTIRVWDFGARQQLRSIPSPTGEWIRSVAISAGGRIAVGSMEQVFLLALDGQLIKTFDSRGGPLCFSPDGRLLAGTTWKEGRVTVWDIETGKKVRVWRAHAGLANGVAFSRDGRALATAGSDGAVRLWDVATQRQLAQLRHEGEAYQLAFSPDGGVLATTGTEDRLIKLWDISFLRPLTAPRKSK